MAIVASRQVNHLGEAMESPGGFGEWGPGLSQLAHVGAFVRPFQLTQHKPQSYWSCVWPSKPMYSCPCSLNRFNSSKSEPQGVRRYAIEYRDDKRRIL